VSDATEIFINDTATEGQCVLSMKTSSSLRADAVLQVA
jgi:hypothetical protein